MAANRTLFTVYAVVLMFTVLSGDTERYALTWYGWAAIVLVLFVISVVLIVRRRHQWRISTLPFPLLAFIALVVLSIIWSDYRGWTAVAAVTTIATVVGALALALTFPPKELLRTLGLTLRIILAGSILFELAVSLIIRHPFVPWWAHYSTVHPADYWSRDLLLKGDRIQGIMGNSDLLGFVALLGLIVFGVELATRKTRRGWSVFWLLVAVLDIALTRSGTVFVALAVVAVAAIVLVLIRRARSTRARRITYIGSLAVVVIGLAVIVVFHSTVLRLLGKNSTLTGRTGIWSEVILIARQRPIFGWGWISYWVPGLPPFNKKAFNIGGIQYLQAHDAWLDVWLQLGVIGLIVFAALAISTLVRAWTIAIDRPQLEPSTAGKYDPASLLPVLILIALLAQSITESRLLIEYGLLLLSLIAIKTKRPDAHIPKPRLSAPVR